MNIFPKAYAIHALNRLKLEEKTNRKGLGATAIAQLRIFMF
jgi:hypothetical protein